MTDRRKYPQSKAKQLKTILHSEPVAPSYFDTKEYKQACETVGEFIEKMQTLPMGAINRHFRQDEYIYRRLIEILETLRGIGLIAFDDGVQITGVFWVGTTIKPGRKWYGWNRSHPIC